MPTPKGSLNEGMRRSIWESLDGSKNGRRWESLVDFTLDQLMKHLAKKFKPGMTWENRGEWHIDHKIPLSAFNFETPDDLDFRRAWALKNLQPLWAIDNLKKGAHLSKPFQPSLLLSDYSKAGE